MDHRLLYCRVGYHRVVPVDSCSNQPTCELNEQTVVETERRVRVRCEELYAESMCNGEDRPNRLFPLRVFLQLPGLRVDKIPIKASDESFVLTEKDFLKTVMCLIEDHDVTLPWMCKIKLQAKTLSVFLFVVLLLAWLFYHRYVKGLFKKEVAPISKQEDPVPPVQEERMCCVCMVHRIDTHLRPCGHSTLCGACANKVTLCPSCRSPIHERLKAFF